MTARYTHFARPLTLNAERKGSQHWSRTREQTRAWREAFWALGAQTRHRFRRAHVTVEVVIKGPMQDTGACFPSVKAAIDGLVDARVLPDDGPQQIASLKFVAPRRPRVGEREHLTLELTAAEED